jgi:regulator of protease activity HflC (stomatin/prohibitin superfamily)
MSEGAALGAIGTVTVIVIGGLCLWGCPSYNVYSAEMSGRASLAEADSSRQIKTVEAKQHMESAQYDAQAEVTRATGAAKAMQILQNQLGGPDGYLRYLQIQALETTNAKLIYVPTDRGLPITEAARLAPRTEIAK